MHRPSRWILFRGLLPLLVAASGSLLVGADPPPPPSPPPSPVTLAYRFCPDEAVVMTVAHRARTETTISGTTQSTDTATDSRKRWRVVSVDAEGKATIEHSVDHVTMTSRTSDRGEVRWSSDGEDPPPPGYETVRGSLGVPLSRVVIDRAGRVISRIDLQPTPPSASGDLMVVPLPDGEVEIGAEWSVPQEVVVETPGGPRRAVRTRLRYRLESVRDDVAVISIDTTVLTPIDDPRLESRLLERIWNGEIEFDIPSGRVIRRSTGIDRRVVGFSGQESSVRYRSTLEERLVPEEAPEQATAAPAAK
jgi:hypothetical protein